MTTQKPKHDQLFRKSLENPIVAYELLQAHLPQEVLAIIDTSTLKLEKESFIEHNLTASIADVLFSVKFNGNDGFIYLLLEHQSSPDHFMAFRLFKYMVNICDRYRLENQKTKFLLKSFGRKIIKLSMVTIFPMKNLKLGYGLVFWSFS
jgi:predicted transposase/invertase (TIGR01784 family)